MVDLRHWGIVRAGGRGGGGLVVSRGSKNREGNWVGLFSLITLMLIGFVI